MATVPLDGVEHDYPLGMLSAMSFAIEIHSLYVLLIANGHFSCKNNYNTKPGVTNQRAIASHLFPCIVAQVGFF